MIKKNHNYRLSLPDTSQISMKTRKLFIKTKMQKTKICVAFKLSEVLFFMQINVKMPTSVCILTFMSMIMFMLSCVNHEKLDFIQQPAYIISEPEHDNTDRMNCESSETQMSMDISLDWSGFIVPMKQLRTAY